MHIKFRPKKIHSQNKNSLIKRANTLGSKYATMAYNSSILHNLQSFLKEKFAFIFQDLKMDYELKF